jgi:2-keto-4-pentenoate hydratase
MTDETAHHLIEARRTHRAMSAASCGSRDAEAAYAAQDAVANACGWFREAPAGHWKSGGPSRDAVLTHAALPPAGVWTSPAEAQTWPFRLRGIEAEIALRLGRTVDPALAQTLDARAAAELVDALCVSIEIVDSRWTEGLDAPALAKLADIQSHGALVLGPWHPFAPRDWQAQVCRVQVGAQPPVERQGTHSLADPVFVLPAWLRHATRDGRSVPAGTVVTTGTWVGILHADKGDLVTVEFPGVGSASVQL